jgi:hypothetical protein
MNVPNNLKCHVTLGWKGLQVTNTLAYLGPFVSSKENEVS